jgi:hypothetical protein
MAHRFRRNISRSQRLWCLTYMLALIDGEKPAISLGDDGIPPIWIGKYRANIG